MREEEARAGRASALPHPWELQHQGHLPASASPAPASSALSAVAGTGRTWAEPDRIPLGGREGQQLSLSAPVQPGEQVAEAPLLPPDTQDNTQCLLPPCEWGSVGPAGTGPAGSLNGGRRVGAGSFLPGPRAAVPTGLGVGVGDGALGAPSCSVRCLPPPPVGFQGNRLCWGQEEAVDSSASPQRWLRGAWPGDSVLTSRGGYSPEAPTAPRTSPMMSPKWSLTWMRPVVW